MHVRREVLEEVLHALGDVGLVLHHMEVIEDQNDPTRQCARGDDEAAYRVAQQGRVVGIAQVGKGPVELGVRLAQRCAHIAPKHPRDRVLCAHRIPGDGAPPTDA